MPLGRGRLLTDYEGLFPLGLYGFELSNLSLFIKLSSLPLQFPFSCFDPEMSVGPCTCKPSVGLHDALCSAVLAVSPGPLMS